ncbi:MAG: DUF2380 domain-containing protein [Povalibacter sp.]
MHRSLLSVIATLFIVGSAQADPHDRIAVLEFELNDLTLDPRNTAELERTASIRPMLEKVLTQANYTIASVDTTAQDDADKGVGYLFDHADAAATLGHSAGADWVVVGRVHKASFLFVYFKVHVVKVATAEQIADLVVEVKGPQKALTAQGVESLANQIAAVVEESSR